MKRIVLAVLLIAATVAGADDLVEAAKAAKAKRKKSTTKVITNADVKKAKSILGENKLPDVRVEPRPTESALEKHEREKRERSSANLRVAASQQLVTTYEKELAAVEQRYYEENDLQRRDTEIVRRFNDVKAKLDAARKELEAIAPPPAAPIPELHSEPAH